MKNISKHVSWKEGTYSRTGERLNLDNTPNEEQIKLHERSCRKFV